MDKEFVCICGYTCVGSQKYNAHRAHCKVYLQSVGKYEKVKAANKKAAETGRKAHLQKLAERKQAANIKWLAEKHTCATCGITMTERYGSGKYCSRACANTRKHSAESKERIKASMTSFYKDATNNINRQAAHKKEQQAALESYLHTPNFCSVCGSVLPYNSRNRKTCSDACLHKAYSNAGKLAAAVLGKRSKNEIAFCTKCEDHFGIDNVLHNEPMFNGWDADIIIPEYKIAVLWNGPWHYRTVVKGHSLTQVQTRDTIKISEIEKYGFIPYIIKDLDKESLEKVNIEFTNLLNFISNLK